MIFAGFGFRASAQSESLADALRRALTAAGSPGTPNGLATATDKAATRLFRDFAQAQSLPALPVDSTLLQQQNTQTHAPASLAARGTGSLAEAAALAAAGPGARLLGSRQISQDGRATCALAQGDGI